MTNVFHAWIPAPGEGTSSVHSYKHQPPANRPFPDTWNGPFSKHQTISEERLSTNWVEGLSFAAKTCSKSRYRKAKSERKGKLRRHSLIEWHWCYQRACHNSVNSRKLQGTPRSQLWVLSISEDWLARAKFLAVPSVGRRQRALLRRHTGSFECGSSRGEPCLLLCF